MTDTKMHKCLLTDDELENLREYQQGSEQANLHKEIRKVGRDVSIGTTLLKIGKLMLSLARNCETDEEFHDFNTQIRLFRADLKSVKNLNYSVSQYEGDVGMNMVTLDMLKAKLK
jgi:hypothetical protein